MIDPYKKFHIPHSLLKGLKDRNNKLKIEKKKPGEKPVMKIVL